MAFVKLPDDLRYVDKSRRAEFILFVGAAEADDAGAIRLVSPWESHRLQPGDVPIDFHAGEVAAVLAIAPTKEETGPIVAAANLDTDERADLLAREGEMLKILGQREKPRSAAGAAALIAGRALWRSAVIGGAVFVAASAAILAMRQDLGLQSAAPAGGVAELLTAMAERLSTAPALEAAAPAIAAAALAFGAGAVHASVQLRRAGRRRRLALDDAWRRATDVFVFARRHADVFRVSARPERSPAAPRPRPRRERLEGRVVTQQRGAVRWPDHLTP